MIDVLQISEPGLDDSWATQPTSCWLSSWSILLVFVSFVSHFSYAGHRKASSTIAVARQAHALANLPTIAKFFERLVNVKFTELIDDFIIPQQHGFMKNRSTATNLMEKSWTSRCFVY